MARRRKLRTRGRFRGPSRPREARQVVRPRGELITRIELRVSAIATADRWRRRRRGDGPGAGDLATGAGPTAGARGPGAAGRLGWLMSLIASDSFPALGTTAGLFVTAVPGLERARRILEEELTAIDEACSRFRPDSELALLNRGHGCPTRASEVFLEAIEVALHAARATNGAVDPTVGGALGAIGYDCDFAAISEKQPKHRPVPATRVGRWREIRVDRRARTVQVPSGVELDLGATAKALAADRAARRAQDAIGGGVLVNLGGDLSIAGPGPPGGWLIQVSDDHAVASSTDGQTVRVAEGGLATSSTTVRRWATTDGPRHHIVDPASGDSVAEVWRTVSVAAGSCVHANVATTAAIIRGETAPDWLHGLGLPSRLVARDGRVIRIGGWPEEIAA